MQDYYNGFYKELSRLDELGNNFTKIESFLPKLNGHEKILDIGCGHGGVCHNLIKKGFHVSGVEINQEAIASLKKKNFNVIECDITKELNIKEKFEVVLLLDILEHLFDPYLLLKESKKITTEDGYIIATIPLYFDIVDRFKILFTGSVISMDNLCYGRENYEKFRSYNYDHIRFFRPKEVFEMGNNLGLKVDKVEYQVTGYGGKNLLLKILTKLIANKYTLNLNPSLLAHSMKIRWKIK
ncbi:class I SAM-dependent methyltransferase [Candidatus Pseudothioglobus sp. Uisw_041]|jgi:2-polyprenyl-3-methyl-5-hydroxy-6-metoxy-1,4-benzoquinol methylase|uniref:class I SAM-dependent methyltransferase n=1 Tax=Candidatus Pseudothioglobus sp. Uisw_041 TaxID=3230996 RepID=UPI003A8BAF20